MGLKDTPLQNSELPRSEGAHKNRLHRAAHPQLRIRPDEGIQSPNNGARALSQVRHL
jgi:hypothetical protein